MTLSLIAALAENRAIGKGNQLLCHISEDLKRFRAITSGHPIVMGRKTYESIGRLLPGRLNVIITRQRDFSVSGARIVHSIEEGIKAACSAPGGDEVFIIGGAEIYRQALPLADRLYLTYLHRSFEGDAFFPEWEDGRFVESFREPHLDAPVPFSFVNLEKPRSSGVDSKVSS